MILLSLLCCSREEVLSIQEVAKSQGLEVIPLVQTFGHMEVREREHISASHLFISYPT